MDAFRTQLDWSTTAARTARHQVSDWLQLTECADGARDDVVLAASELVTRTINLCAGPPTLSATIGAGQVHLWVESTEPIGPADTIEVNRQVSAAVLAALCQDWGVETSTRTTRMWAELPC